MSKFHVKVYVVQDEHDKLIAVKLTFAEAHRLARDFAPAKVTLVMADKTDEPNALGQELHRPACS